MANREFLASCLHTHNDYRVRHGAPKLKVDVKLIEFAQTRAIAYAQKDRWALQEEIPYGENVYVTYYDPDYKVEGSEPVVAWYLRQKFYDYEKDEPENLETVQAFTQIVWRDTKKLGVGRATNADGKMYVVCIYDPPGNIADEFATNVQPVEDEEGDKKRTKLDKNLNIKFVEPQRRTVQSMNRIYSVPSEKLRVWSGWLSKVGNEAYQWHRWIRMHIHLINRLFCYLNLLEEGKGEEEIAECLAGVKLMQQEDIEELLEKEYEERMQEKQKKRKKKKKETKQKNENVETKEPSPKTDFDWPIGVPWEGAPERFEPLVPIDIPKDKEEMKEFLREFKNKAAIYVSLNQHWKETSDQAVKEIVGRDVIPTATLRSYRAAQILQQARLSDDPRLINLGKILSSKRLLENLEARDWLIRDLARADENIPYFFYLKDDIDNAVAIEFDDENVLLPDPHREQIMCGCESLYYNLNDKPGDDPWL